MASVYAEQFITSLERNDFQDEKQKTEDFEMFKSTLGTIEPIDLELDPEMKARVIAKFIRHAPSTRDSDIPTASVLVSLLKKVKLACSANGLDYNKLIEDAIANTQLLFSTNKTFLRRFS